MSDIPGNPIPTVFRCGGTMAESGEDCTDQPLSFGGSRWRHSKKALDRDHTAVPVAIEPEEPPVVG